MWIVGYVVAPTLFSMLDHSVAGTVAGRLFAIMSYLGLVCAVLLLIGQFYRYGKGALKRWPCGVLLLMLVLIAVGQFVLAPQIAALRDAGLLEAEKSRFAMLHGTASVLFLLSSLAGLALVIFGLHAKLETSR